MMDCAEEVIPGVNARGHKLMSPDLWFFACHFPGDPTVPGVLQLEAIVQLCALTILTLPGNKGKVAYLTHTSRVRFKRKVLPGERLDLEARLLSWKRGIGSCSGKALVGGQIACEAEFGLALPDELTRYQISAVK